MMLIALHYAHPAQINSIKLEVKKHGFYSAYCDNVIVGLSDHEALIAQIKKIAVQANLLVTFNKAQNVCIFEAHQSEV